MVKMRNMMTEEAVVAMRTTLGGGGAGERSEGGNEGRKTEVMFFSTVDTVPSHSPLSFVRYLFQRFCSRVVSGVVDVVGLEHHALLGGGHVVALVVAQGQAGLFDG